MKIVYPFQTFSLSLSLAALLVGCGGGGGSTSTISSTTSTTYSISGTVPGTLIEAYCEDGSFYNTSSTNNGTSKHPFSLEIPSDLNCKLVMITNETAANPADYIITPIEFESDTNVGTYLTIDKNIDLGNVPLETPGVNSGWSPGIRTPLRVTMNNKEVHVKSLSSDPMDTNNDGIPNVYENDDGDSLVNKYDDDYDNNGIKDVNEASNKDKDHDGILDIYDKDTDNDGIPNIKDTNDNNQSDNENHENSNNNTSSTITLPSTFTANTGRLLGSQCAQCHGTNGVSSSGIDSIKGEDNLTHEIYDDDALMNAQANGYTSTEILAIESWLNNIQ
jgi:hypothetical protein